MNTWFRYFFNIQCSIQKRIVNEIITKSKILLLREKGQNREAAEEYYTKLSKFKGTRMDAVSNNVLVLGPKQIQ